MARVVPGGEDVAQEASAGPGPAGPASRDICGTWPGSRSSHRCRSRRCPAAGAGTGRTAAACSQNCSSSTRFSQPRTRCGRSSRPARIRPAWEAEMPVSASCPAIRAWVHTEVPSGGADVAAATIRNLTSGPVHLGPAAAGPVSQGGHAAAGKPGRQVRTVDVHVGCGQAAPGNGPVATPAPRPGPTSLRSPISTTTRAAPRPGRSPAPPRSPRPSRPGSRACGRALRAPCPASPAPPRRTGPATPPRWMATPPAGRRSPCSRDLGRPAAAPWPGSPPGAARSATSIPGTSHRLVRSTSARQCEPSADEQLPRNIVGPWIGMLPTRLPGSPGADYTPREKGVYRGGAARQPFGIAGPSRHYRRHMVTGGSGCAILNLTEVCCRAVTKRRTRAGRRPTTSVLLASG